ncbi:MAG TPA: hypothetical protein VE172_11310 [Stackebrandtia sp.]|jgi:hypothetical protein|uniref:hypothetical protein n=1 Tax=Stackebrandtia sp. TaxID=2023065 RepID=UPI002D66DCD5|nr:hypothetical protein [Stackebrandtia sp.]HZE39387.1 hypothetical protein [Stackebrandtia sp.]
MNVLRLIFLFAHLLGFAMLFGGWLTAYLSRRLVMNPAMLAGTATQIVSGLILAAPWPRDHDLNMVKIGIKLVLGLALAVMVWVPHLRKRETVASGHFIGIGALTVVTAGIAVLWT